MPNRVAIQVVMRADPMALKFLRRFDRGYGIARSGPLVGKIEMTTQASDRSNDRFDLITRKEHAAEKQGRSHEEHAVPQSKSADVPVIKVHHRSAPILSAPYPAQFASNGH